MFAVIAKSLCPNISCITFKGIPILNSKVAALCLSLPPLLDKEGHIFLRNEETILDVRNSIVVLRLDQHIIILAQVNDPSIGGAATSEKPDLEGCQPDWLSPEESQHLRSSYAGGKDQYWAR